jgi:hypothetical protein
MDWDEFIQRTTAELRRLGLSDRDGRFIGYDKPNEDFLSELAELPDGLGAVGFYNHFGVDMAKLERDEEAWLSSPPSDA